MFIDVNKIEMKNIVCKETLKTQLADSCSWIFLENYFLTSRFLYKHTIVSFITEQNSSQSNYNLKQPSISLLKRIIKNMKKMQENFYKRKTCWTEKINVNKFVGTLFQQK